jgi:hypothetical protein
VEREKKSAREKISGYSKDNKNIRRHQSIQWVLLEWVRIKSRAGVTWKENKKEKQKSRKQKRKGKFDFRSRGWKGDPGTNLQAIRTYKNAWRVILGIVTRGMNESKSSSCHLRVGMFLEGLDILLHAALMRRCPSHTPKSTSKLAPGASKTARVKSCTTKIAESAHARTRMVSVPVSGRAEPTRTKGIVNLGGHTAPHAAAHATRDVSTEAGAGVHVAHPAVAFTIAIVEAADAHPETVRDAK